MKTIIRTLIALTFVVLCIDCRNKNKQHKTVSKTIPTTTPENKGQAFIKYDEATPNILNIAMKSEDHTTLVTAVQAAGLENALVNAGPLTVFAPTNTAFDKLPEGTVANLLKPENKKTLADILKYHVTPGSYSKGFLKKFKKLGQSNGKDVTIRVEGDDVYIGDAKIIADIKAGNGMVHVIDKVLLPPKK